MKVNILSLVLIIGQLEDYCCVFQNGKSLVVFKNPPVQISPLCKFLRKAKSYLKTFINISPEVLTTPNKS